MAKKNRKKISRSKSNAALRTALDATATAPLAMDIYESIIGALEDYGALVDEVAKNLDPKVTDDIQALTAARLEFCAKLDPSLIHDFEKLSDCVTDVAFWRKVASFYLGAAVASTLRKQLLRR
jgi:hypothetical protein